VALLKIQVLWGVSLGEWLPLFQTFIVSSFSGSGSQRGANLEDEDTIAN